MTACVKYYIILNQLVTTMVTSSIITAVCYLLCYDYSLPYQYFANKRSLSNIKKVKSTLNDQKYIS